MEETLALEGGGRLALREEGLQVHLEAVCPDGGQGVYKIWIWGAGGSLLLGTPAPEGGALRLRRRVSRRSLEQAGCWPVTGGQLRLALPAQRPEGNCWARAQRPGGLLADPVLERCADAGGPFLICRTPHGFRLAAPWRPDRPFPLTPLFCLARIEPLGGALHAVFSFRGDGTPILPA